MFVVSVLSVVYLAIKTITAEAASMVSAGDTPNLKLSSKNN
jgi:hypothetical protein